MTLPERLEKARRLRGWTPYKLAKEAGVTPQHVGRMLKGERGVDEPTHEMLSKLAKALRVSFDWLAEEKGPMDLPAERVLEKEDRYSSRPIALDIMRRGGFPAEVVKAVASMELDSDEDPGEIHWIEQGQALRALHKGKAAPAVRVRAEDVPAPRGPRKRTGT